MDVTETPGPASRGDGEFIARCLMLLDVSDESILAAARESNTWSAALDCATDTELVGIVMTAEAAARYYEDNPAKPDAAELKSLFRDVTRLSSLAMTARMLADAEQLAASV